MDEPCQQSRFEVPQVPDGPASMEPIRRDRQPLGIEEIRQRSLDVLQSRPGHRLDHNIDALRREIGETLRLTVLPAHHQPSPVKSRQGPHSDAHPPAFNDTEATPISGDEDRYGHGHNLRTTYRPRWIPSRSRAG